jgi:hypothetical protein
MSSDALARLSHALRAGPWLALSLALIPAVSGATEPALQTEHAVAPTAKPRIGRIFFSPAERRGRHTSELGTAPATTSADRTASSERLVVNGALSSPAEARAVWINGATVDESSHDKKAWTDRNGNVWVNLGARGTHRVQPGQSIDHSSGAIDDLLPAGSVTRH